MIHTDELAMENMERDLEIEAKERGLTVDELRQEKAEEEEHQTEIERQKQIEAEAEEIEQAEENIDEDEDELEMRSYPLNFAL